MSKPVTNLDFVKTSLRLPRQMHLELAALADRNGTSVNTEILKRLAGRSLEDRVGTVDKRTEEIKALAKEILDAVRPHK